MKGRDPLLQDVSVRINSQEEWDAAAKIYINAGFRFMKNCSIYTNQIGLKTYENTDILFRQISGKPEYTFEEFMSKFGDKV